MKKAAIFALLITVFYSCGSNDRGELVGVKSKKKWFSEKHPEKWIPLYSRVTFSHQPYSEALAIGDKQDAIMQDILAMESIEEIWETEPIEQRILQLLRE